MQIDANTRNQQADNFFQSSAIEQHNS